ncbi:sensor histidine kinase [Lentzea sp. NPDC051213]|uniref:sensor histidine kinase n=1 Tax=Lentzea sp. NPDC051213 TaxID=3364126 RepID=UPI0037A8DC0A
MPVTGSDPRPTRFTVRVRLTALYSSLFLGTGAVLLAAIYLLMRGRFPSLLRRATGPEGAGLSVPAVAPAPPIDGGSGDVVANRIQTLTLDALLLFSGVCLVVVAVLAAVACWWLSGRVLRPLHTITATARRLSSSNLHERLALHGPRDELTDLAETLDDMLDRLESAFDSQKRFVANASHELRTPLAVQRAAAQIGLAGEPTPAETARTRDQILTANRQIERLIDGLLVLARSDRGLDIRVPVPLHEVVAGAVEQHRAEAVASGVRVRTALKASTVLGDHALLQQLAANLVTNAIRHNSPGGAVWVSTSHDVLVVTNTGPKVTEEEIPLLFEPFHRGQTRGGSGLGLSIVDSIARAHDGTVTASAQSNGGLRVTVTVPVASETIRKPSDR